MQRTLVGGARCDDELSTTRVRHAALVAVVVQEHLAPHAEACLQGSGRIVDSGVYDAGVPTARSAPDTGVALDHEHFAPGVREGASGREANYSGAHNDRVYIHPRPLSETFCRVTGVLDLSKPKHLWQSAIALPDRF